MADKKDNKRKSDRAKNIGDGINKTIIDKGRKLNKEKNGQRKKQSGKTQK